MAIPDNERASLLWLARQAVEATVRRQALPNPHDLAGVLAQRRGCFVTLTSDGELRGCIGTFAPERSLGETIVEMASAAARDPRFMRDPITPAELERLHVEVSVLSPLVRTDRPEELQIGQHGIYIISRRGAGCFLPEVATDMGWNAQEFLSQCCLTKAHLPGDAWRDPATQVFLFTSEKFDR